MRIQARFRCLLFGGISFRVNYIVEIIILVDGVADILTAEHMDLPIAEAAGQIAAHLELRFLPTVEKELVDEMVIVPVVYRSDDTFGVCDG